jgi:hypothetical protein
MPPELAAHLSFMGGDVRTVRTGKKYDAVISLFHVMSYQNGNADLKAVFSTAEAHLDTGGVFMFDYWYGPAVLLQKPESRVKRLGDNRIEVTRTAKPALRLGENIVDVNYSVSIRTKATGETCDIEETHSMRYLFLPEIPLLSGENDWQICANTAWMKDTRPRRKIGPAFQSFAVDETDDRSGTPG